jgi:hypothetical protein
MNNKFIKKIVLLEDNENIIAVSNPTVTNIYDPNRIK